MTNSFSNKKIICINIVVRPGKGGTANCSFKPDGSVHGGHMSGGNPPFVHMDQSKLSEEIISSILEAAYSIDEGTLLKNMSPDTSPIGGVDLSIQWEDNGLTRLSWPFEGKYPDEKVRKLVNLIYQHRVGGW